MRQIIKTITENQTDVNAIYYDKILVQEKEDHLEVLANDDNDYSSGRRIMLQNEITDYNHNRPRHGNSI